MARSIRPTAPSRPAPRVTLPRALPTPRPVPGVITPRSGDGITGVFPGTGMGGGGSLGDVYMDLDTPIAIPNGGTGGNSAAAARTALGVPAVNNANLTGVPNAPTASDPSTSTSQIATTAFVHAALNAAGMSVGPGGDLTGIVAGTGLSGGGTSGSVTLDLIVPVAVDLGGTGATTIAGAPWLPLSGGTISGNLLAPTAPLGTHNQLVATTAFVQSAIAAATVDHVFSWVPGDNLDTTPGPVIFTAAVAATVVAIQVEIAYSESAAGAVLEVYHNNNPVGTAVNVHQPAGIYHLVMSPEIIEMVAGDVLRARIGFSSHDGAGHILVTFQTAGGPPGGTVTLDDLAGVGGTDAGFLERLTTGNWQLSPGATGSLDDMAGASGTDTGFLERLSTGNWQLTPGGPGGTDYSLDIQTGASGTDTGFAIRQDNGDWRITNVRVAHDGAGNVIVDDNGDPLLIATAFLFSGDVEVGTDGASLVQGLRGRPVANVAPQEDEALIWKAATGWTPGEVAVGPGGGGAFPFADQLRVRPVDVEGVELGATTVQGAIERLQRMIITGEPGIPELPPVIPGEPGVNLLSNPHFVEWNQGNGPFNTVNQQTADGWYVTFSGSGGTASVERHTISGSEQAEIGDLNATTALWCTFTGGAGGYSGLITVVDKEDVIDGATIEVSFWGRANAPMQVGIALLWEMTAAHGGQPEMAGPMTGTAMSFTTGWEQHTISYPVGGLPAIDHVNVERMRVDVIFSEGRAGALAHPDMGLQSGQVWLWGAEMRIMP